MVYSGVGRKLVLSLKHGDRTDLAPPMARWMLNRLRDVLKPDTVFVPVPLHRWRLMRRRYNQAGLLAQEMARQSRQAVCVDATRRVTATRPLDGIDLATRFATLADAIIPNPKRAHHIAGRPFIIVDDVMTSGATLAATTEAVQAAGAINVSIVTLARVVKDP